MSIVHVDELADGGHVGDYDVVREEERERFLTDDETGREDGVGYTAAHLLPHEEVVHYGVISPEPIEERVYRVRGIVEKPSLKEAPSDLAIVGRYILAADVWPLLERTQPGANGEMQLTDTLTMLIEAGHPLFACEFQGERFDTGRPLGLLEASVTLALRREDIGPAFKQYLRSLSLS